MTLLEVPEASFEEWYVYNERVYLHSGYRATPAARAPKPGHVRRCPWCGDLVLLQCVDVLKRSKYRRKKMLVSVEPHPDGRVIALPEGRWVLRRSNQVAYGPAFFAHSAFDCAGILHGDHPPDKPYPENGPRTYTEAVIRQALLRALERSDL